MRAERRREVAARKRHRRVDVGPYVTFYFECYDTMWLQIQEMLHIEKGGPEQIPDELAAYNPLIPNGTELVATFMIEIDDPVRRANVLGRLGGIEESGLPARRRGDGARRCRSGPGPHHAPRARPRPSSSCTSPSPRRRSPPSRRPGAEVVLGLDHPDYRHMAVLPEPVRAELAGDFD